MDTKTPSWSKMSFGTEYLSPTYYNKILKKYSTADSAVEDTELLVSFLKEHPDAPSILELGCGSGRATQIIAEFANYERFIVTDLSRQMLDFVRDQQISRIASYENIDHLKYLQQTKENFDLAVSLWSLAHSVFPWYREYGISAFGLIETILTSFFTVNLNEKGRVFIIQTDGASEEQSLIKKAWFLGSENKHLETEYYRNFQSPSIWILNDVFKKLTDLGTFDKNGTQITHVVGKNIDYESVDEALEIFMNFHLEGEFNGTIHFEEVYTFLKDEFEKIIATKGQLSIGTGFWIYKAQK